MRTLTLLIAAAALATAADDPADAVQAEKAKLIGTWKVVSLEANGFQVPPDGVKDLRLVFTADSMTRKKGDKAESGSGYKLDPSKSPKWIDLTGQTDGKDVAIPAVYELDGDSLQLCFPAEYKKGGKPVAERLLKRPAKLDGGKDTKQVLMVLKREPR
jgi:uncharacterized protein (TIGR03067 family)